MNEKNEGTAIGANTGVMATTKGKAPDPLAVLRAHRSDVNAVAFHQLSGLLLSGGADGELKIWDVERRRCVSSSRVHSPTAGVIGIGANAALENRILSQGRDGSVKCWQLCETSLSRQPIFTIETNTYNFCKLSLPKFIKRSSVVGSIGAVCHETPGGQYSSQLPLSSANLLQDGSSIAVNVEAACVGRGKPLLVIAGEEPSVVEIWDMEGRKRVQQLRLQCSDPFDDVGVRSQQRSAGMCMAVQSYAEGSINVLAGYEDGSLALWDIRNPGLPYFMRQLHSEPVLSICLDEKCQGGASGGADDKVIFFKFDHEQSSFLVKKEMVNARPGVTDISIRHDDKIVATAGWDHRVRIYDYHRMRPLAVLKYHSAAVTGVAFSEDCKMLASSSRDATIALWSIYPPN